MYSTSTKIKVLITGITGQDGIYLTKYILSLESDDYEVHGIVRKSSINLPLIRDLVSDKNNLILHFGDITENQFIEQLILKIKPLYIFNFAAQSHVMHSFSIPNVTNQVNYIAFKNILKIVTKHGLRDQVKILQASSSEMFGDLNAHQIINEHTPMNPVSPYGQSKYDSYKLAQKYREKHSVFVSNSIAFNHESPLRNEEFVTRKVTKAAARIKYGLQNILKLGTIDTYRDWGHAKDYVEGFWHILSKVEKPDDFVLSTGITTSVRDFVQITFKMAGFQEIEWKIQYLDGTKCDILVNKANGQILVQADDHEFVRKNEIYYLQGSSEKLNSITQWKAETTVSDLIKEMLNEDLAQAQEQSLHNYQEITQIEPMQEPTSKDGNNIVYYVSCPYVKPEQIHNLLEASLNKNISSKAKYTQLFEENLQQFFKVPSSKVCSNGYSAIVIALKALNIQRGDQVIMPTFTMVAVANAVIDVGAYPIVVDNSPNKLNPSVSNYSKAITPSTKAIIVCHTYGIPADIEDLVELCKINNIYLIEDIAEATGAKYKGQYLGTFGDFACASLYANKLFTSGDGGFIISRHDSFQGENLNSKMQSLINHGFTTQYHFYHQLQTGNHRMSGLSAAFAYNTPKDIDLLAEKRFSINEDYRRYLIPGDNFQFMPENQYDLTTPWVFGIMLNDSSLLEKLRQYLYDYGIETRNYFRPIHQQPFFQKYNKNIYNDYNVSLIQYSHGLYLPTYNDLSSKDIEYISKVFNSFFTGNIVDKIYKTQQENSSIKISEVLRFQYGSEYLDQLNQNCLEKKNWHENKLYKK